MPISTPDGKSNAAPAGESKYYKNYMTPGATSVTSNAVFTGGPGYTMPGEGRPDVQPQQTFQYQTGPGPGGGQGTRVAPDLPYIAGGTPWIEQAQAQYAPSVESEAFATFADGQSMEQMEIALAEQYDKMLAQQLAHQSKQQQAAEDMLRAQAMQMGVGGSPGGALSDWAGVQSQGAQDRASIRLAHEAERANAENAMREEYTRLSNAEQAQIDNARAKYQQYFIETKRSVAIGPRGENINPRFQQDLDSLYQLMANNNVPQNVAEGMIDELTSQWMSSGLASVYRDNAGRIAYPGLDAKFGAKNAYLKTAPWVTDQLMMQDPTFDGYLTPGMNVDSTWFGNTAHLGTPSFLGGLSGTHQGQMFTLGQDINIYPAGESTLLYEAPDTSGIEPEQYWAGNY